MFKHPVFPDLPSALRFMDDPRWESVALVETAQEAQDIARIQNPLPQPITLVVMTLTFPHELQMRSHKMICDLSNVHAVIIEPSDANQNQWQLEIEAFVIGDRRYEYPDHVTRSITG